MEYLSISRVTDLYWRLTKTRTRLTKPKFLMLGQPINYPKKNSKSKFYVYRTNRKFVWSLGSHFYKTLKICLFVQTRFHITSELKRSWNWIPHTFTLKYHIRIFEAFCRFWFEVEYFGWMNFHGSCIKSFSALGPRDVSNVADTV